MGYRDENDIYHPQHKEDGWSDEMNENLTKLGEMYADYPMVANKSRQLLIFSIGTPVSIPNASGVRNFDLAGAGTKYDPMSAIQTGTYNSLYDGGTYTAGQWLRVPAGVWMFEVNALWAANASGERIAEIFHIDSRMETPDINPMFGNPNEWQMLSDGVYRPAATIPANGFRGTLSVLIITPEMVAAANGDSPAGSGWALTIQVWQNSGAPLNINGFGIAAARIA